MLAILSSTMPEWEAKPIEGARTFGTGAAGQSAKGELLGQERRQCSHLDAPQRPVGQRQDDGFSAGGPCPRRLAPALPTIPAVLRCPRTHCRPPPNRPGDGLRAPALASGWPVRAWCETERKPECPLAGTAADHRSSRWADTTRGRSSCDHEP